YFRSKDREKNKSIEAYADYASVKTKKPKHEEVVTEEEDDNSNPTDSYSARNVNPEYVSRSNSEKASEDESNYYLEGYTPPAATTNFNNSYYNNANWARSSYYANAMWNSPYYGIGYYSPWASPYYGGGFYDPWMNPYYGTGYGMGPSYGWRTGWSLSFTFGNYWSPWGYGYGGYPYYGGYGYGYPSYYYGGGYYNEPVRGNYGKRPSRHSAAVTPTQRTVTRTRSTDDVANVNGRTRKRQAQDDYYVRPSRRNTGFNPGVSPSSSRPFNNDNSGFSNPTSRPSRSRDLFSQPSTPSHTPSHTPSYSPSPSRGGSGGGGGGGGGGSSPRPRGRG
ncbi:MAG TPA: hypothetical protein PKA40_16775, partial [Cyclobacteriaceae bacterium]|nr:hypothetical protein [Cyclobacteriaceae bacterium]